MKYVYVIEKASDGSYSAYVPDLPGCVAVEPPYLTDDGSCLVGISKWESEDAFRSSGITLRASDEIVPGETRPRERFLLREA